VVGKTNEVVGIVLLLREVHPIALRTVPDGLRPVKTSARRPTSPPTNPHRNTVAVGFVQEDTRGASSASSRRPSASVPTGVLQVREQC